VTDAAACHNAGTFLGTFSSLGPSGGIGFEFMRTTGEIMGDPIISRIAGRFAFACVSLSLLTHAASANDSKSEPPKFWAVTGVATNDVLNMRDVPDGDSKKLGAIPPNAHGIKNIGCMTPTPSLERWMVMTPAEKANSKLEWCRIEYKGQQGWVAARFLKPDAAAGASASGGASSGN
jgi:hypothetical protein